MSTTISRAGLTITIHSTSIDLTTIMSANLTYTGDDGNAYSINIPSSNFLSQTATDITLTLPDTCRFLLNLITVTFTGTQFSGSVALGTLAILLADASGMYRIVVNQRHDTLYVSASIDNSTQNVAIPTPFAKTGFIGG